jgi:hypothetical protein
LWSWSEVSARFTTRLAIFSPEFLSLPATSTSEALANLKEALELYFEDVPVPEALPAPIIVPVEVELRVPHSRSCRGRKW